ncbi:MAG: VWA domain-containing protein [Pseudoxanthomonas sp.]
MTACRHLAAGLFPLLMLALGACSQSQPTPTEAATASDTAASKDRPLDPQAEAKHYYQQLVAQYGQDYAACGPSERTLPQECAAAKDIPGAGRAIGSNVLLMLDASGSMAARIGGQTKMQAAQDALSRFAATLPAAANVALRVYGHTGNNKESGRAESCAGSALLYPFQKGDAGRFEAAIRSFRPTGWTPLAASLDAAVHDFAGAPARDGANVVYVVSDGIETCGGDPVAAARRLHESDIDVVVNVVGFDVDAQAAQQLEAVAKAGGGEYLAASSGGDLDRIFSERWTEAQKRYNCVFDEQQRAYNQTFDAQQKRYNCLFDKAQKEYNDIFDHAQHEYNATFDTSQKEYNDRWEELQKDDSIDPDKRSALQQQADSRRAAIQSLADAKRKYAQRQADAKRESIQKPADEERTRVQGTADEDRARAQRAADEARGQAQDAAEQERDAGRQR